MTVNKICIRQALNLHEDDGSNHFENDITTNQYDQMRKVYMNMLPLYVQDGQIWVKNICSKQLRRCAYNHSLLPAPPFSWFGYEIYKKCDENFGMTLIMSVDLFLFNWSAISDNLW